MNSLTKRLPNEIVDIIARKLHESIISDLHEEFNFRVDHNKAERRAWTEDGDEVWPAHEEFDPLEHLYERYLAYGRGLNARHYKTASNYRWWPQNDGTLELYRTDVDSDLESESEDDF